MPHQTGGEEAGNPGLNLAVAQIVAGGDDAALVQPAQTHKCMIQKGATRCTTHQPTQFVRQVKWQERNTHLSDVKQHQK